MCGIVGLVNTRGFSFKNAEALFEQLLWMDTLRGYDATGVFTVRNKNVRVFKRALMTPDFFGTAGYNKVIKPDLPYAEIVVGHNRAATRGRGDQDANAHPFTHEHITLVHNGHIENVNELLPIGKYVSVDSAVVPYAMAERGEKEGLESLEGAYSLVWYNAKDNTLNFARNSKRPMFAAYLEGNSVMAFASEVRMLDAVIDRCELKLEGSYKRIPEHVLIKVNPNKPTEVTRVPFVPTPVRKSHHYPGITPHGQGSGGVRREWPNSNPSTSTPSGSESAAKTTSTTNSSTHTTVGDAVRGSLPSTDSMGHGDDGVGAGGRSYDSSDRDIDNLEKRLSHLSNKERRSIGLPSSRKKLRRLADSLFKRTKTRLGEVVGIYPTGSPTGFKLHKNQRNRGMVDGVRRNHPDVDVQIIDVTPKEYDKLLSLPQVYGVVIDGEVRAGKVKLKTVLASFTRNTVVDDSRKHRLATAESKQPELTYVTGPDGDKVELGKFMQICAGGCANCEGHVNPHFADKMAWVNGVPICHECAADPSVRSILQLDIDAGNTAKRLLQ